MEDCAQILCRPKGQDYSGKYAADYEDIADIINKYSARAAIDLARFYRRVIVAALLGNCDAHLKNFSLLETSDGLRLSPAYDLVNTAIYDGFDQSLALTFNGKKVHLDAADTALFRDFGKRIGLPERAVDQALAGLKSQVRKAAPLIEPPEAESPDGFVHRFSEIVSNSCRRILGQ